MGTRAEYESLRREYASVCGSINGKIAQRQRLYDFADEFTAIEVEFLDIGEDLDSAIKSYNEDGYLWYGTFYNELMGDYRTAFDNFTALFDDIMLTAQAKALELSGRIDELNNKKYDLETRICYFVIDEEE